MTDFAHLLRVLTRSGVEFIIIGGFAAIELPAAVRRALAD